MATQSVNNDLITDITKTPISKLDPKPWPELGPEPRPEQIYPAADTPDPDNSEMIAIITKECTDNLAKVVIFDEDGSINYFLDKINIDIPFIKTDISEILDTFLLKIKLKIYLSEFNKLINYANDVSKVIDIFDIHYYEGKIFKKPAIYYQYLQIETIKFITLLKKITDDLKTENPWIYICIELLQLIQTTIFNKLYEIQLEEEASKLQNKNIKLPKTELSKQFLKLIYDKQLYDKKDIFTLLHTEDIQKEYFGALFKCKINYDFIENKNIDIKSINIPEIKNLKLDEATLKKSIGLNNINLTTLVNNSDINICFAKKEKLSLVNDIKFRVRQHKSIENNKDILSTNGYISELIKNKQSYIINDVSTIDNYIYLFRTSILDIQLSDAEIENIKTKINECKHRYVIIYCSQIGFGKPTTRTTLQGGTKLSIIIDKHNKKISIFNPIYPITNSIYQNGVFFNLYNYVVPIYLMQHFDNLGEYSFLFYEKESYPAEYVQIYIDKNDNTPLTNYNMSLLFDKNHEYYDWAVGYCGLWSYLYANLLIMNPDLGIADINYFLSTGFVKRYNTKDTIEAASIKFKYFILLLIRNFAHHAEQILKTKGYVVNSEQINLENLANSNINNIALSAGTITYEDPTKPEFHKNLRIEAQKEKLDKLGIKISDNSFKGLFYIFINELPWLFSSGGQALYNKQKINFIDLNPRTNP